jgi:hypothetical protein
MADAGGGPGVTERLFGAPPKDGEQSLVSNVTGAMLDGVLAVRISAGVFKKCTKRDAQSTFVRLNSLEFYSIGALVERAAEQALRVMAENPDFPPADTGEFGVITRLDNYSYKVFFKTKDGNEMRAHLLNEGTGGSDDWCLTLCFSWED